MSSLVRFAMYLGIVLPGLDKRYSLRSDAISTVFFNVKVFNQNFIRTHIFVQIGFFWLVVAYSRPLAQIALSHCSERQTKIDFMCINVIITEYRKYLITCYLYYLFI